MTLLDTTSYRSAQCHAWRIGIFDSGLGGLSVFKAMQQHLPTANLYYVADSGFAPYGPRSADYVRARCRHIAAFLMQHRIDALVIACNTATAAAAELLRAELALPVIAMEPGLKPAIEASDNGIIGVLATQGTLASQQFARLRERFGATAQILDIACSGWVGRVEAGLENSPETYRLVATTLAPALAAGVDTLVLGCTHFPFLRAAIAAACGEEVQLIETAQAVALQTLRRLPQQECGLADAAPQHHFWSSGDLERATRTISRLIGYQVQPQALPDLTGRRPSLQQKG